MTTETASPQFERAWFSPRFLALIIDQVILGVVWMITGFAVIASIALPQIQTPPSSAVMPTEIFTFFTKLLWILLVFNLLVFVYFVAMEAWLGATIGKKLAGIRSIDLSNPGRRGLPLIKALGRQSVLIAPFLPSVAFMVFGINELSSLNDPQSLQNALKSAKPWLGLLIAVVQLFPMVWLIWIGISLVNKRDPVYDRLAGTAVVRA